MCFRRSASGSPASIEIRPAQAGTREDDRRLPWPPPWLRDAAAQRRKELVSRIGSPCDGCFGEE